VRQQSASTAENAVVTVAAEGVEEELNEAAEVAVGLAAAVAAAAAGAGAWMMISVSAVSAAE